MTSTWRDLALVDACGWGSAPRGLQHRELEPVDVILSYFYAKELVFCTRILFFDGIISGNNTVLNKLQSNYRLISASGPEGHCTSCF